MEDNKILTKRGIKSKGFSYDFGEGLTEQYVYQRNLTFRDTPAEASIYNWFKEVHRGRRNISDKFCENRPRTDVTPENIDAEENIFSWIADNLTPSSCQMVQEIS